MIYKYILKERTNDKYLLEAETKKDVPEQYQYTYSYRYHWINTHDNLLATCRFNGDGRLVLTDKHLKVLQGGKRKVLELRHIKQLSISFKRLILPVVIGGIVVPLALLGLFSNYLSPWVGLGITFLGVLLFYYGFRGGHQLDIDMHGFHLTYFLDDYDERLSSFTKQANQTLWKRR